MTIYKKYKNPISKFNDFKQAKRVKSPSPKLKNFEQIAIVRPNHNQQIYKCTFINPDTNIRCTRNLGIYPEFCEKHTMAIQNLFVDKSNIFNGGMGLFAGEHGFKKGDIIGRYSMDFIQLTWQELENRTDNPNTSYVFCNNHRSDNKMKCWDALDYRSTVIRYANDSHGSKFSNNAYFDFLRRKEDGKIQNHAYMIASKNIPAFQEIYCSYGDLYF